MYDVTSPDFQDAFERRQQTPVVATPTPLPGLNRLCRDDGGGQGFAAGWFITLGGNPGFGKSILALNFCHTALQAGEAVAYISLEMTVGQLSARFYSISSGEAIKELERGSFDRETWTRAKQHMAGLPALYVPERVSVEWESVVTFIKGCFEKGCRWFVLDFLQLVQAGTEDRIYEAMSEIVTDLRAWAVNERATVVALSQFNRQTSSEYHFKPRSQGLWGGMILEASSDLVLLLDHSRYRRTEHGAMTWLVLDKNRHGPIGDIPIMMDYRTLQIREGLEDEVHEWPTGKKKT